MDSKKILIIVIIIGIFIGIAWIVLKNTDSTEKSNITYKTSPTEVFDSLSEEEKETLKNIKNGKADGNTQMPDKVKDIFNPPSLRNGLENMLNK